MRISELLSKKARNINGEKSVTIAFLGDSVTQGCFEIFSLPNGGIDTVYEPTSSFSARLREILAILYPSAQVNIINSGISGDSAKGGLARLERDVLRFSPDLTVVSYGLNDCSGGMATIPEYLSNLGKIFDRLAECGSEIIFLTQNFYNTGISPHLKEEKELEIAKTFAALQSEGVLKAAFDGAKKLCAEKKIKVCDLYSVWEKLHYGGVNTTELLSNKINHPAREMHYYMAMKLAETMLDI